MRTIKVEDFSRFPGPRYIKLGPNSGEKFRDDVLLPEIKKGTDDLIIDLDNVFGYGSSFLEEAFGGLIRAGVSIEECDKLLKNMKSEDDPKLLVEIKEYIYNQSGNT